MGPTLPWKPCPARAATAFASALLPTPVPPLEGAVPPAPAIPFGSPSLPSSSRPSGAPGPVGRHCYLLGTAVLTTPQIVTLPHRLFVVCSMPSFPVLYHLPEFDLPHRRSSSLLRPRGVNLDQTLGCLTITLVLCLTLET